MANVCATAGRIAAREGSKSVSLEHFSAAVDRVCHGLEKPDKVHTSVTTVVLRWGHVRSFFWSYFSRAFCYEVEDRQIGYSSCCISRVGRCVATIVPL